MESSLDSIDLPMLGMPYACAMPYRDDGGQPQANIFHFFVMALLNFKGNNLRYFALLIVCMYVCMYVYI